MTTKPFKVRYGLEVGGTGATTMSVDGTTGDIATDGDLQVDGDATITGFLAATSSGGSTQFVANDTGVGITGVPLILYGGGTGGSTSITSPNSTSSLTFTLPATAGSSGYVLSTNGSGTLSWVANPDTNTTYTINSSSTTGGANFNLAGSDATTDTIKIANGTAITAVATDANTITITNTGVTSAVAGTGVGVSAATGDVTFSIGQSVATTADPTFNSIQLTAGTIKSSAGTTAITVSNNDATIADFLTVGGDMRVNGNTIQSSSGVAAIELSGSSISTAGLTAGLVATDSLTNSTGSSAMLIGTGASAGRVTLSKGYLTLSGQTSGSTTFVTPATAVGTYTLPSSVPAVSGYVLSSTTGGTLSWVAQSGGGGGSSVAGIKSLNSAQDSSGTGAQWAFGPGLIQSPTAAATTGLAGTSPTYIYYVPIAVDTTIDISAFCFYVQTATGVTVALSAQVFINNVDDYWQPTTNALYLGEITGITTTGQKSLTGLTGKVLSPGNYILGIQLNSYTATTLQLGVKSAMAGSIPGTAVVVDGSLSSIYFWAKRSASTYVSGTAPLDTYQLSFSSTGSNGIANTVWLRWTKV